MPANQSPAEAHGTEPSAWTDADIRRAANMSWSDAGSAETVTLTERTFARVVRQVASILGAHPQPKGTVVVSLDLIRRAQQAINWHLEPDSPDEHEATMLELAAIGWPDSVPPTSSPAPAQATPRPFDAVKSFADSVLKMLDERITTADRNSHPFMDKFGDHPETIVAAQAQAGELREVRTQVRILGDRALVDLMKFRQENPAPAVQDGKEQP